MTNAQEYVAGTIPTDSNSVFKITSVQRTGQNFQMTFLTVSGKTYRVEYSDTLDAASWLKPRVNASMPPLELA